MPVRKLSRRRALVLVWAVAQACNTYGDLRSGSTPGGGAAAGSNTQGGSGTSGGTATSGTGGTVANNVGGDDAAGGNGDGDGGIDAGGAEGGAEGGAGASLGGQAGAGNAGAAGSSAGAGGSAAECTSAAPDLGCSCITYSEHDYWFCTTYLALTTAEKRCKGVGMHLPKIETQAEDNWLLTSASGLNMGEYYLGATDATTPNEWSWLAGGKFWSGVADGTAYAYTNWSPNEPNASGDCLVVQVNGPWDDRDCTDQRRYICESL